MTVNTTTNKVIFSMDGSTVNFDFTFAALDATHIKATEKTGTTETALTYTAGTPSAGQYSVSVDADGVGGTVTVGSARDNTYTLTVYREVPLTQLTDYNDYNSFPAETTEDALDKLSMASQQLEEELDRSLKGSITESGISYDLPDAEANKVLAWDSAGTAIENKDIAALSATEKASQAEAEAGTDDDKFMTPLKTKQSINANADLVNDTTPQLGGDLDLNGKNIDFPTTANISDCLDEDDMASDSATKLATQQSIKAYVDNNVGGSVKAWINLNGTGTIAIRDSYNVSSIVDNGTGDYTVQFTNNAPDANYCVVATPGENIADGCARTCVIPADAMTTSQFRIFTGTIGSKVDVPLATAVALWD